MAGEVAKESDSGQRRGGGSLGTVVVDADGGYQDLEGSTLAGSGVEDEPPSSSRFQVQEALAREYKRMSVQLKLKQAEMEDLQDNLNCRINCLTIAEKEMILSFHKVKQLIKDNQVISTTLAENGGLEEKEEEKGEDSESTAFKLAIKHYGGSLLENLTQHHFQRKLDDLSAIFGDTLRKANERIMQVETELKECQVIASQLLQIINMASQQQQSPHDDNSILNSIVVPPPPPSPLSPPTPPKTRNEIGGGKDDDNDAVGGQDQLVPAASPVPMVPPSTDSSGVKNNTLDVSSDIVEQNRTAPCSNIINILVKEDHQTEPIHVPGYLTTVSQGSPPTDFHAWKIYSSPANMKFFECGCQCKFITFSGLVNHLRKLKLITIRGTSSASPPALIIFDDDLEDKTRSRQSQSIPISVVPSFSPTPAPPPSSSNAVVPSPTLLSSPPSAPPPQSSSGSIVGHTLIQLKKSDDCGDGSAVEKKRCTRRDPCSKVIFQCNAKTLLSNGKPCGKYFKSFWGMRRHKRTFHALEVHVAEWGCPVCSQIFRDEKKFEWHKLYDNCRKRKANDLETSEDEEMEDD